MVVSCNAGTRRGYFVGSRLPAISAARTAAVMAALRWGAIARATSNSLRAPSRATQFQQEIVKLFAGWHDRPGCNGALLDSILFVGRIAYELDRLIVLSFRVCHPRERLVGLHVNLRGPVVIPPAERNCSYAVFNLSTSCRAAAGFSLRASPMTRAHSVMAGALVVSDASHQINAIVNRRTRFRCQSRSSRRAFSEFRAREFS